MKCPNCGKEVDIISQYPASTLVGINGEKQNIIEEVTIQEEFSIFSISTLTDCLNSQSIPLLLVESVK